MTEEALSFAWLLLILFGLVLGGALLKGEL